MANLLTAPITQFVDENGSPLVNGKVYTYVTGASLTPKATYTDSSATTPLTNPVILDSNGSAEIWLSGAYRIRVADANDVIIWDVDDISTDASATASFSDALFELFDNADATKKLQFQLSSISTGTTRVYTWPNKDGTVAMLSDIAGAVLLSTQTVGSPVATIDFTSGIDSTYLRYVLQITGLTCSSAGANLQARFSRSGSFLTTADYNAVTTRRYGSGATLDGTSSYAATRMDLTNAINLDTSKPLNGTIELASVAASISPVCFATLWGDVANFGYNQTVAQYTVAGAIDGFRLFASAGNLTGGTVKLYGIP